MKINKRKAILGSFSALAAIATPVATVVACSPKKNSWEVLLGVPTADKASPSNIKNLNEKTAPTVYESLKNSFAKTPKLFENKKGKIETVSFGIMSDNDAVAKSVISGKAIGAFVPSEIMSHYKTETEIAFLAARNAMYADAPTAKAKTQIDNDSNATNAAANGKALIAKMNTELGSLEADFTAKKKTPTTYKHENLYSDQTTDFYRASIYFDNPAAKQAWDAAATPTATQQQKEAELDKFMKTGIITHHASSASGYIVPEKMIKSHFGVSSFKLSDPKWKNDVSSGHMKDLLGNKKGVYFSFAGEALQSSNPLTKFVPNLKVLELSTPIPNDGFIVKKGTNAAIINALREAFIKATAVKDNMLKHIYYHQTYKVPSPATKQLIMNLWKTP